LLLFFKKEALFFSEQSYASAPDVKNQKIS